MQRLSRTFGKQSSDPCFYVNSSGFRQAVPLHDCIGHVSMAVPLSLDPSGIPARLDELDVQRVNPQS